mmetsp:Transcript_44664/g.83403  ORF Transcript_44664/g.83403 Transcript_44664/m.83403 type:complete len:193 (+) Transcript_44664:47-625(+)
MLGKGTRMVKPSISSTGSAPPWEAASVGEVRAAGARRRCDPGCYEGNIKELFELSPDQPLVTETRGSQDAAKLWPATKRQAARIRQRPAWQPQEVPISRRLQQEKEWKRLLTRKGWTGQAASTCSRGTRSSDVTAATTLPAGIATSDYDRKVERDGAFLWQSQVVAAFNNAWDEPQLHVPSPTGAADDPSEG